MIVRYERNLIRERANADLSAARAGVAKEGVRRA